MMSLFFFAFHLKMIVQKYYSSNVEDNQSTLLVVNKEFDFRAAKKNLVINLENILQTIMFKASYFFL